MLIKLTKFVVFPAPRIKSFRLVFCLEHQFSFNGSQYRQSSSSSSSSASSVIIMDSKKDFQRLPSSVIPTNYALKLQPNLETLIFHGQTTIDVTVKEKTSQIVLNAAELEVTKVTWNSLESQNVVKSFSLDPEQETLSILMESPLVPGKGSLSIEFIGTLNDKLRGFYRSKYQREDGTEVNNAVTQFAPTDARRCFPCWDEPAIKSTFDVSLVVPKSKVALSNMPVSKTIDDPANKNLHTVEFERSPFMSTYLVTIVTGEFDYVEGKSRDGVLCRVYTPPGKKEQGNFALEVTVKALPFYKEYFGLPYPLRKLDLIAVADFNYGAMEGWGLITYRETKLLVDDINSSASNRQFVALVVAHELAHQWFGNYVTMEWWTHLWLNEGYASFVQYLSVHELFPHWQIWSQFVSDTFIVALELDALDSSHPIEVPVNHPDEITEIFDVISYKKGASIIRMLHDWIGIHDFKKGMNLYLTRHQYGNTVTEDLWKALEEGSGKPIGAVMSTWTAQMGMPLVSVVSTRQEGSDRVLTLSQEKYSANLQSKGTGGKQDNHHYSWKIPLTFASSKDPKSIVHQVLMEKPTLEVRIPNVDESQWIILNPGAVGYYRVQYTTDMLAQLVPALREQVLLPLDRLSVVDNLFALVNSGQSSTVQLLQVLEALVEDENYTVWASICNILGKLNLLLAYTEGTTHDAFKSQGRHILSRIVDKIGFDAKEGESHLDTLLRSLVLNQMVNLDHKDTIEEAKNRLAGHLKGENVIPADLRQVSYKALLENGDQNAFELLVKTYREADGLEEKERIGRSLGALKDPVLLQKALEFAMSSDVRSQDSTFIVAAIGMSPVGRDLAWKYVKDNLELFKTRYLGGPAFYRLCKQLLENFAQEEKAREIESFFKKNPFPGTERSVQQAIESIRLNEAWLKRDAVKIHDYLQSLS